jgi:hypothetical protein
MEAMGHRQMGGGTFRIEEARQRAVGGGDRLPERRNIGSPVERNAPAFV